MDTTTPPSENRAINTSPHTLDLRKSTELKTPGLSRTTKHAQLKERTPPPSKQLMISAKLKTPTIKKTPPCTPELITSIEPTFYPSERQKELTPHLSKHNVHLAPTRHHTT